MNVSCASQPSESRLDGDLTASFEAKIADFIGRFQLLDVTKRYLVALSGGADSVCLLIVLKRLGYQLEAIHCHFHLRGTEADADEQFAEALCCTQNIPFHRAHFDTISFAKAHHMSIETAARVLRYRYFDTLMDTLGIGCVCVGHHGDDVAETVLMNLVRGTGIHGLTGIASRAPLPEVPNSGKTCVRPLLCTTRSEIEAYLKALHQPFVTDSTNLANEASRNQVRNLVMPRLAEVNSAANHNLAATARRLRAAEQLYDETVDRCLQAALLECTDRYTTYCQAELLRNECLLFEVLAPLGFSPAAIEDIFDTLTSSRVPPSGHSRHWKSDTHTVTSYRGELTFFSNSDEHLACHLQPRPIPAEGLYRLGAMGTYRVKILSAADFVVEKTGRKACLDADKIGFPLTLRPTLSADKLRPYGMKGSKTVGQYLTARHRTPYQRLCQLVLTDARDVLLWVVGETIDARFAVGPDTQRVLLVEREDV